MCALRLGGALLAACSGPKCALRRDLYDDACSAPMLHMPEAPTMKVHALLRLSVLRVYNAEACTTLGGRESRGSEISLPPRRWHDARYEFVYIGPFCYLDCG